MRLVHLIAPSESASSLVQTPQNPLYSPYAYSKLHPYHKPPFASPVQDVISWGLPLHEMLPRKGIATKNWKVAPSGRVVVPLHEMLPRKGIATIMMLY